MADHKGSCDCNNCEVARYMGPKPEPKKEQEQTRYVFLNPRYGKPLGFGVGKGPRARGMADTALPPTYFTSISEAIAFMQRPLTPDSPSPLWEPHTFCLARVVPGKRLVMLASGLGAGHWVVRVTAPNGHMFYAKALHDNGEIEWGTLADATTLTDADLPSMGRRLTAYGFWLAKDKGVNRQWYRSDIHTVPVTVTAASETYEEVK